MALQALCKHHLTELSSITKHRYFQYFIGELRPREFVTFNQGESAGLWWGQVADLGVEGFRGQLPHHEPNAPGLHL